AKPRFGSGFGEGRFYALRKLAGTRCLLRGTLGRNFTPVFVQNSGYVNLFRIATAYLFVVRFRLAGLDFFVSRGMGLGAFACCSLMAGFGLLHRRRGCLVSFVSTRSEITPCVITCIEFGGFMIGRGGSAVCLCGCILLRGRLCRHRPGCYCRSRLSLRHVAIFRNTFPGQNNWLITGRSTMWFFLLRPWPAGIAGIEF